MSDKNYISWAKMLEHIELIPDERREINAVAKNFTLIHEFVEDAGVHWALNLLSQSKTENEKFVTQCIQKYFSAETNQVESRDNSTRSHELEIVVAKSKTGESFTAADRIRQRKIQRTWSVGILAIAASLVIGMFIVLQSRLDLFSNGSATRNEDSAERGTVHAEPGSLNKLTLDYDSSDSTESLPSKLELDNEIKNVPEVFAQVHESEEAKWRESVDGQIGRGFYRLDQGQAMISMDNQSRILLVGPAEIELLSVDHVRAVSGKIFFEFAGQEDVGFKVELRDGVLASSENSRVFVNIGSEGTNFNLDSGQVSFRSNKNENLQPVILDNSGLRNAYVNNTKDPSKKAEPNILIAHGLGNQYFAQIGAGEDVVKSDSPSEFDQIITKENQKSDMMDRILQFNQRLRQLRNEVQRQGLTNGSSPGREFVPGPFNNLDQFVPFSNPRDFEEFKNNLFDQFRFPDR